jgi:hypothetical protein
VTEAGGVVRAIDGGEYEFHMTKSNLICGNAEVIPAVVEVIRAADQKMWKKARVHVFVYRRLDTGHSSVCMCAMMHLSVLSLCVYIPRAPPTAVWSHQSLPPYTSHTHTHASPSTNEYPPPKKTRTRIPKIRTGLHDPSAGMGRDWRHHVRSIRGFAHGWGAEAGAVTAIRYTYRRHTHVCIACAPVRVCLDVEC